MRSPNWFLLFLLAAVLGVGAGYLVTLIVRPTLLPPALRLGALRAPQNILLLGTDVVYLKEAGKNKADWKAFTGRSDTIIVAHLDPVRNTVSVLSIPRDTVVHVPGHGRQKINSANAIGGPELASEVISSLLGIPMDHFVVLNVHGLVRLVDELGGISVDIPKRMYYRDRAGKLTINLKPGRHNLDGDQAMGFVRFRHDALGDIGRVQRQEIFLQSVLDKAMNPESWTHIPELITIAKNYVLTDLSDRQILELATFVRAVPPGNRQLVMLPGEFSDSGDWNVSQEEVQNIVARLTGKSWSSPANIDCKVAIENKSADPELARKLSRLLRAKGYEIIAVKSGRLKGEKIEAETRIIAQRANPEEARRVKGDLGDIGKVVNASVGDIQSSVTILAGDDLSRFVAESADDRSAVGP